MCTSVAHPLCSCCLFRVFLLSFLCLYVLMVLPSNQGGFVIFRELVLKVVVQLWAQHSSLPFISGPHIVTHADKNSSALWSAFLNVANKTLTHLMLSTLISKHLSLLVCLWSTSRLLNKLFTLQSYKLTLFKTHSQPHRHFTCKNFFTHAFRNKVSRMCVALYLCMHVFPCLNKLNDKMWPVLTTQLGSSASD